MRKYIYLLVPLLTMVGCSNEGKLPSAFSDQEINIKMEVQDVSDAGLILHIVNEGTTTIGYGYRYSIEELKGSEWIELPFIQELAFVDSRVLLPPSEQHDEEISFGNAQLSASQKYRVIKVFSSEEYSEEITLAAEFSVEQHAE